MDTQPAEIYVMRPSPQPLAGRADASTLFEIAEALAENGSAYTPPRAPLCGGKAPRVLNAEAIARHPPLRIISNALPRGMRLVVVVWGDGAAVLTAISRRAGPPPEWWLQQAYEVAASLPPPPANLPQQPWALFAEPKKGARNV